MNQTDMYVDIMQDSLKRKRKYLEEILELTKNQEKIVSENKFDSDAFEETVDKKEILINNINEIDKGFTSVYDRIRSELLERTKDYKKELGIIQNLIRICMDKGMEIEALEERNKAKLELTFSNERKNLRQVKQSRNVANKYYKSMSNGNVNDSMLYDRKK